MTDAGRLLSVLVITLVVVLGVHGVARGHGDAAWIGANPKFKSHAGIHCCGVNDCEKVAPENVRRVEATDERPAGYEFLFRGKLEFVEHGDHYGSIDEDFWACGFQGMIGPFRPGCAFAPRDGS